MRSAILVLAVALTTGAAKAHADMLTYNMTGTITKPGISPSTLPFNVAVGDHVSWTLRYDASAPATSSGTGWIKYSMSGPVITNVVDQTTGYHFPSPSPSSITSWMQLGTAHPAIHNLYSNSILINDAGGSTLSLMVKGSLPTLNLAHFQLNKLTVVEGNVDYSLFQYAYWAISGGNLVDPSFFASVDSISGVTAATPEPGSLTLFLLGAAGLAIHGLRRRLRFRLVSFLAVVAAS